MDRLRTPAAVFSMLMGVLFLYGLLAGCLYLQRIGVLPEATRP